MDIPRDAPAAPDDRRDPRTESHALALEDVSVRYPGSGGWAVRGVSLCVRGGDVVGLLGPNGAGKSTLLRLGAGLVLPTEGTVRVGGTLTQRLSRASLARSVAFVAQSEIAPAGFRVREVVAMGRAPHQGRWMHETARDRAVIDEAIAAAFLGDLVDRRVETLSGGELRRVAIARALAQKPRVLLLDEPGAFLDVRHRLELYERIVAVAGAEGVACVVAMHDLESAVRFASRVVLLRDGAVVAAGRPAEALTPDTLREALNAEIDVGVHGPSGRVYFVPVRGVRD